MTALPGSEAGGLSSLEQVQEVCQTQGRPFLKGINHDARKAIFFRPRCKLWSCPACSEINKRLWAVRAFNGAEKLMNGGAVLNFLTLTSHERLNASGSLKVWPKAWAKLRERVRYETGGFQFLLVPEQHKNHRLHVHAIETAGLGRRWWKDNARECGLGFMADETEVQTAGGAASYTTKYLTKALLYQHWPKGFRRVRTSQGWPKLEKTEQPDDWYFEPLKRAERLDRAIDDLERAGYDVIVLDHYEAWEVIQDYDGSY